MTLYSQWRDRAEMMTPPMPWDRPRWRNLGGPPVILLHGLGRGWRAMEPLARALAHERFSSLNIPYPSTRKSIPELVGHVRDEIEKVTDGEPVHFITHSLGGILLRALMAEGPPWKTGRVVMLAPPNGGSEIVDWAARYPLIQRLLGPAGCSLGSEGVPKQLPAFPKEAEVAVIMGKRCAIPLFQKLLDPANDGIVSVERGKIPGLREFAVIDADHTFIQMHPEAIRLSLNFLKYGAWSPPECPVKNSEESLQLP